MFEEGVSAQERKSAVWPDTTARQTLFGRIVSGSGVTFVLEDGRHVLDASNTGGPLGHRHPEMVEAMVQAASAPVVNEAWNWINRDEAANDIRDLGFRSEEDWFGGVMFCLSGSEANDLALSLAQAITGRSALATRQRSYHGGSGLARAATLQPQWHGGLSWRDGEVSPAPQPFQVVELPAPVGERIGPITSSAIRDVEQLRGAKEALTDVAAVIVDYTQGGIYYSSAYQETLAAAATNTGTLWIADEVVTGFGRTGTPFAFQGGSSRPDIVTLGKALGAGAAPVGAVVISRHLADRLAGAKWQTGGTFRGHPSSVAAIRAHLRIMTRERLAERAAELDSVMFKLLTEVAAAHPAVSRIDGRGLHWTVELHGPDWRSWRGATSVAPLATIVAARALRAGALIGTSGEESSLFLAPPLIVEEEQLEQMVAALDEGLNAADEALDL